MTRLRPPIRCHGGKFPMVPKIIPLLPPHRCYVEPFVGGGSILLNLPGAEREVAGDLDAGLVDLWQELKPPNEDFLRSLDSIQYDERTFNDALDWASESMSFTTIAIGYLVRNRMSLGGRGDSFARPGTNPDGTPRLRQGLPDNVNAWRTILGQMPAIAERVRDVEFRCGDALGLIAEFAPDPDCLIFADPPYVSSTRTAKEVYAHEMTDEAHGDLLRLLDSSPCKAAVSGYRHEIYDSILADWTRHDFDVANHSAQGKTKQRRTECLWVKA